MASRLLLLVVLTACAASALAHTLRVPATRRAILQTDEDYNSSDTDYCDPEVDYCDEDTGTDGDDGSTDTSYDDEEVFDGYVAVEVTNDCPYTVSVTVEGPDGAQTMDLEDGVFEEFSLCQGLSCKGYEGRCETMTFPYSAFTTPDGIDYTWEGTFDVESCAGEDGYVQTIVLNCDDLEVDTSSTDTGSSPNTDTSSTSSPSSSSPASSGSSPSSSNTPSSNPSSGSAPSGSSKPSSSSTSGSGGSSPSSGSKIIAFSAWDALVLTVCAVIAMF